MGDLMFFSGVVKNRPATISEIQKVKHVMGVDLPNVYENFLKQANGIFVPNGVVLYGTDDIVERNITWEVSEYASHYVAIGDDSGGNVFMMLQNPKVEEVLIVDVGDMNPQHASLISLDFNKWVERGGVID